MKVEETIPAALDGERIDRVVSLIADISRSDATKLIADGGAEVDGAHHRVGGRAWFDQAGGREGADSGEVQGVR